MNILHLHEVTAKISDVEIYLLEGLEYKLETEHFYFIQAYFLIEKDKPCFTEKLLAKDFGPIVPMVYETYKSFGNYDICLVEDNTSDFIDEEDKHLILAVVDFFADYMPTELLDIIFKQKPFKDAYSYHSEITVDALKAYFTSKEG